MMKPLSPALCFLLLTIWVFLAIGVTDAQPKSKGKHGTSLPMSEIDTNQVPTIADASNPNEVVSQGNLKQLERRNRLRDNSKHGEPMLPDENNTGAHHNSQPRRGDKREGPKSKIHKKQKYEKKHNNCSKKDKSDCQGHKKSHHHHHHRDRENKQDGRRDERNGHENKPKQKHEIHSDRSNRNREEPRKANEKTVDQPSTHRHKGQRPTTDIKNGNSD
ncbi:unnamed protein product [Rotaria magnacalcarata]|uniref:Uncharacterized protein n=1 Tax=Rotaria magnacalcarata TaxID=392030 RepID=A0A816N1P6_9BILA|nr:unnamed protein product [Rotaria magnacalcarata]